jgi:hypothetical protein
MSNKADTSEYSSSKAPETRPAAEERDAKASTLIPGGSHGSPTAQGMAGLEHEPEPVVSEQDQEQKS